MRRFAEIILRYRQWVLVAWLSIVLIAGLFAAKVSQILQGGADAIPRSQSDQVTKAIKEKFGAGTLYQFLVVMKSAGPNVHDPSYEAAAQKLADVLTSLRTVRAVKTYWNTHLPEFLGRDNQTALAVVTPNVDTYYNAELMTKELRSAIQRADMPKNFSAYVTSMTATLYDLDEHSASDLLEAERIGLPITLIILLIVFGSPLAAVLPIILALAAVAISLAGLFWLSQLFPVSIFAENAVSMIGLGVGIDYALFILSRFRQELSQEHSISESVARAVESAGRAVLFSGATVAIGFLALFLVNAPFLHAIALGGTFVVIAAVAAALTLLPVLLSYLGTWVNWPRRVQVNLHSHEESQRLWSRWAERVLHRPLVFLSAGILVLVLLVAPILRLQPWNVGAQHLSPGLEARQGYELLAKNFYAGWMGPVILLVAAEPGKTVWDERNQKAILDLSERLSKDKRVAQVQGFSQLLTALRQVGISAHLERDLPESLRSLTSGIVSPDGRTAILALVTTSPPESRETMSYVRELRRDFWAEARSSGLKVSIGGATAVMADFDQELYGSLWRVVPAVMFLTFVVLLVLFRSLLLPLKATVLNLLSVLAAYGFLIYVFQDGIAASWIGLEPPGGLNSFIVLVLFTILFGLSMDYEVFLLSRVREEYEATGNNAQAVSMGLERTAGIITSAALIMVSIFASFGFTKLVATREFGLGLAFAVALDATLIRLILVPALMALLGSWNWWLPGWKQKIQEL
ncbi:MMPL family transporter [Candidatus Acetothermia bacterium]|nr:MMPL family transporter [Candidatus Acetothermia bacterium]